jgi:hypothetical protein
VQSGERAVYGASCHYAGGWWVIRVGAPLDITARVRFLDEVETHARHAIAVVLSAPADSFDLVVDVERAPLV